MNEPKPASEAPAAEACGRAVDSIDNLLQAMTMPLPPATHLTALRGSLADLRKQLHAAYVKETGSDPWAI